MILFKDGLEKRHDAGIACRQQDIQIIRYFYRGGILFSDAEDLILQIEDLAGVFSDLPAAFGQGDAFAGAGE